jgi:hypothetical protein
MGDVVFEQANHRRLAPLSVPKTGNAVSLSPRRKLSVNLTAAAAPEYQDMRQSR